MLVNNGRPQGVAPTIHNSDPTGFNPVHPFICIYLRKTLKLLAFFSAYICGYFLLLTTIHGSFIRNTSRNRSRAGYDNVSVYFVGAGNHCGCDVVYELFCGESGQELFARGGFDSLCDVGGDQCGADSLCAAIRIVSH